MTITRKQLTILIVILSLIAGLCGGAWLLVARLGNLDTYRDQIIATLGRELKRPVSYDAGSFTMGFHPSFTFRRVVVKEPDGQSIFLAAETLTFKLDLLPLLARRIAIHELALKAPTITVIRRPDGTFNISDLLEGGGKELPLSLHDLWLDRGTLSFVDQAVTPTGLTTTLRGTELYISRLARGKRCSFKIAGQLGEGRDIQTIALGGKGRIAPAAKPLTDTTLAVKVVGKNLDVARYWPYYQRYVPFRQPLGRLETDATFSGSLKEFDARGSFRMAGLRFDYQPIFHALLTPRDLRCKYELRVNPREVDVKAIDLKMDGLGVKGSCRISDIHTRDPRITAKATTSTFRLEEFHQYIPYGIIVDHVANWIEEHIKGGVYRLDEGRLDGRVSQILHMERGENYNVLYIKGRVEQGIVSYGARMPTFNSIKGELEMRGKDFNLNGMAGRFGSSPFTLTGKITDYPLNKPSGYPFTMIMNPGQEELGWLLGTDFGKKVTLDGTSTLRLNGAGYTSAYALAGDWDLTPATYHYADQLRKPASLHNRIEFKGRIDKTSAMLDSLTYTLPHASIALAAAYRYATDKQLTVGLKTNTLEMGEMAPLLPHLAGYKPRGRLQASLQAEGTKGPGDLLWRGTVSLQHGSLQPPSFPSPVSDLNGVITFTGPALHTSQLSARIGSSMVSGRGSLEGWKEPKISATFSSPLLNMSDLGLKGAEGPVMANRVGGTVTLANNNLEIKTLSCQVNKSQLNIKGTITNLDDPAIDLAINAPYLEPGDLILLAGLERQGTESANGSTPLLKATVSASRGMFDDIPFEKLSAVVQHENRVTYLQPVSFAAFGGKATAKARIDRSNPAVPRYQLGYNLEGAAADQVTRALGFKKEEITGSLSSSGDLTARGNNSAELKRNSLGSIRIVCQDGTLRRFEILSKIFSILNVSQLLKFQLPDMVSGGMPYDEIKGTIAVKDGILSTTDLFLKSNAMNISTVGSMDLTKEELNLTIGVQPLQTIDKVMNRIPIVGWILTGKDRAFITTYFEAKGKMDNPQVSAIPVKAMAKGVFNIFKRVFQLPAKIFTDSGEVLLGQ